MSLLALLALTAVAGATATKPGFTTTPGPTRATARFVVAYTGSGSFHTHYRSTPPNPGGHADDNHVTDSSSQRWALTFSHAITIPPCAVNGVPAPDPCTAITGVTGGTGPTSVVGKIDHVHVDGLFRADNRSVRCTVRAATHAGPQAATIAMSYDPVAGVVDIVADDPVPSTLALLPGSCPSQGDSIDLLLDNYFTPGFSFAPGYGADRWFTSQTIAIPVARFHDSTTIRIPVALTAAGRPPRTCAVAHRTYEHCTAQGSWKGVVELTASS
jgi:hypothetical protein